MNQYPSKFVVCNGTLYQISNEDWNKFVGRIRDGSIATLHSDMVTKNEAFVPIGQAPMYAENIQSHLLEALTQTGQEARATSSR